MRSAPAIAFDYRPPPRVVAPVAILSLAAMAAPWLSVLPPPVCAALSLAALLIALRALHRFVRPRFRRVACRSSGWTLVDAAEFEHAAELVAHTLLGAWIALDFRVEGRGRFRALLGPGNADADLRRRLIHSLARAELAQAG